MTHTHIFEFPMFITHVKKNVAKDERKQDYIKINFNTLHASPHYTIRQTMMRDLHTYIEENLPKDINLLNKQYLTKLDIYIPINYGTVSYRKDKVTNIRKLSWKPPKINYIPNWDIGNIAIVWLKAIDDVLISKKMLQNDTVSYIKGASYEFHEVSHIDERKIIYQLIPYKINN